MGLVRQNDTPRPIAELPNVCLPEENPSRFRPACFAPAAFDWRCQSATQRAPTSARWRAKARRYTTPLSGQRAQARVPVLPRPVLPWCGVSFLEVAVELGLVVGDDLRDECCAFLFGFAGVRAYGLVPDRWPCGSFPCRGHL